MPITGPASYGTTMMEFLLHWRMCNEGLGSQPLIVRRPDNNTAVTLDDFEAMHAALRARQGEVRRCRTREVIGRGGINLQKLALLRQLNLFINVLEGYFQNTEFHDGRPYAPSLSDGEEVFLRPLVRARNLWTKINAGPAPAGVTLPLELRAGMTLESFTAAVAALRAAYEQDQLHELDVTLARGRRNLLQTEIYAVLKAYREVVPCVCVEFPALVETQPRLTPLPGHTPEPVAASAEFIAPDQARVTYEASAEATLKCYQLRGNVGERYDNEEAVVIATRRPDEAREFVTRFGLKQPGTPVALKVYVLLDTGNEAGSQALLVQRPAPAQPLAA